MALPHLATPAASSSTVCVIDTDAALIERLSGLFAALGATVRGYGSGRAFLDDIGTDTPLCVICELKLPDMAGIEVMTLLRARDITSPVILLAEGSDVATAVTAMRAGALDFVEKPQVDRLLAWHVHRLLEGAGTLRE